jgi:hypothetical protein
VDVLTQQLDGQLDIQRNSGSTFKVTFKHTA